MGCQDVSFDQGTIQSLLAALLQYNTPGRPSNLSIFCFHEKLRDGSENEEMVLLWAMQKDGKTRSQEDIKESLKQVVVARSTYNEMKDQLRIYIFVLSTYTFWEREPATSRCDQFPQRLIDYSSELKYKLDADKFFAQKCC